MSPSYHVELQLDADAFAGKRVLEIGCGPLVPILQFDDCERHGVDRSWTRARAGCQGQDHLPDGERGALRAQT
jgi:hypothetical protein